MSKVSPVSAPQRRAALVAALVSVVIVGLVGATIVLRPHARWESTGISSWSSAADDPLTLVVEIESDANIDGTNVSEVRAQVAEADGMVRVTAWVKRIPVEWATTGVGVNVPVRLQLKSPLDGRPVVDRNGDPIRKKPSP